MSEDKIKRRRFLADILFAGGVVSVAAILAKASQSGAPTHTSHTATPQPHLGGEVAPPVQETPHIEGDVAMPTPICENEPKLGGKPSMPEPAMPGMMAIPKAPPPAP